MCSGDLTIFKGRENLKILTGVSLMAIVLLAGILTVILWPSPWSICIWLFANSIFAIIIIRMTGWGSPVATNFRSADVVSFKN